MPSCAIPLCLALMLVLVGCSAGSSEAPPTPAPVAEEAVEASFDADLARALGADDYGMRRYVLALLKAGPNQDQDSTEAAALQEAHMANIRRLAEEGTLILAGPFMGESDLRGLYLFDVETVEEARVLAASDPAVEAGRLVMELHPWYGSAAVMQVPDIHPRLARASP